MKKSIDTQVAIIGGGITGAVLARELSKYQVDVCVLEKDAACGTGITKACQGLLHGGIAHLILRIVRYREEMPLKEYLLQPFNLKETLQNKGRDEFFSVAHLFGEEIAQCGRLLLAESKEDMEMIEIIKNVADVLRIRGITLLDRNGIEALEPSMHTKFIGGLLDENESVIQPMSWTMAFADNAQLNGVHIYKETEVQDIDEKTDYYEIRTNNGSFKANHVVNAAGLFADNVARMVGAADFEVSGLKAQMLILENRDNVHHVLEATPRPEGGRMLIPTTHNSIVVAHTLDPMTHKDDCNTTSEALKNLVTLSQALVPSISHKQIISNFSGFIAFNTKNPSDHLLETPKRGFINAVVSTPGLGPAPAMAREVVRMLGAEGLELTPKSDFNPYRKKAPRIIDLPEWEKNAMIRAEPRYGHLVCRCENVSEQEIREAVRAGARTLDEIKFRTLAGFGRCQGGFCTSRILQIMAEELQTSPLEITKKGKDSYILKRETKNPFGAERTECGT